MVTGPEEITWTNKRDGYLPSAAAVPGTRAQQSAYAGHEFAEHFLDGRPLLQKRPACADRAIHCRSRLAGHRSGGLLAVSFGPGLPAGGNFRQRIDRRLGGGFRRRRPLILMVTVRRCSVRTMITEQCRVVCTFLTSLSRWLSTRPHIFCVAAAAPISQWTWFLVIPTSGDPVR